ncbi:hypothetical protein V1477_001699 [Vespula maculifrons]|uniref:Secreted protein n=1 Tax=Vespula maculifrons TaxID=7453 RepID=A0ABD2CYJ3_VESMC
MGLLYAALYISNCVSYNKLLFMLSVCMCVRTYVHNTYTYVTQSRNIHTCIHHTKARAQYHTPLIRNICNTVIMMLTCNKNTI